MIAQFLAGKFPDVKEKHGIDVNNVTGLITKFGGGNSGFEVKQGLCGGRYKAVRYRALKDHSGFDWETVLKSNDTRTQPRKSKFDVAPTVDLETGATVESEPVMCVESNGRGWQVGMSQPFWHAGFVRMCQTMFAAVIETGMCENDARSW